MTAKLVDPKRRSNFQVMVLPNLYGDILTDEAARVPGRRRHRRQRPTSAPSTRLFEAIHGSAPRMVREGRAQYADPSSMIRASAMLLTHIGFPDLGRKLDMAMDLCGQYEQADHDDRPLHRRDLARVSAITSWRRSAPPISMRAGRPPSSGSLALAR